MSELTKVTCDVDKDLFKALDIIGVSSKKAFCEQAIFDAVADKVEDHFSKMKKIEDFINFK